MKENSTKEKDPFFSIIVPTYNRPRQIVLCLEALSRINYPHSKFEVIVVDDGSRLPVHTFVTPFVDKMNLTILTQENAGPSTARNAGANSAKGDFLAFTDDDCIPSPDWLQTLSLRFKSSPECAVGSPLSSHTVFSDLWYANPEMTRVRLAPPQTEHFGAKGAEISLIRKDVLLWQFPQTNS